MLHTRSRFSRVVRLEVEAGNTVMVLDHNVDVMTRADWGVDLGPEGGERGGEKVAEGTPEEITLNKVSYTGRFLKKNWE